MMTFFIRLGSIVVAIFFVIIISSGFGVTPFILACIFICAWLTIISLRDNFWWIFFFSSIFGLLYYDVFGLLTIGIIIVAFLFDLAYSQAVRTANDTPIILYGIAFLLTISIASILEVILYNYIFFTPKTFVIEIIMTIILFFFFRFIINKVERFRNLYTHGTDMRCHT